MAQAGASDALIALVLVGFLGLLGLVLLAVRDRGRRLREILYWVCGDCAAIFVRPDDSALPQRFQELLKSRRKAWLNHARARTTRCLQDLQQSDKGQRLLALQRIGEMGPEAREAVPSLSSLIEEVDPEVRESAKKAVAAIAGRAS